MADVMEQRGVTAAQAAAALGYPAGGLRASRALAWLGAAMSSPSSC
ncbi:hypothetical protein ABZ525_39650 [Streptomyces massasporeus]